MAPTLEYPRNLAVRVLTRVLSNRESLDEVLASAAPEVSKMQFGWLHEVCSGTLRWKGRLDFILDSTALKKKPSGWLRKVLLLGAYQLVVQERTQPSLVVSETVSTVRAKEGEAPARFANACLRKVSEHALEWRDLPFPEGDSPESQAAWASLPLPFWKRLVAEKGVEESKAYAEASLSRPTLWLRARSDDWEPLEGERGPVPRSWQVKGGDVRTQPGFLEGAFIVQDISSQLLISEVARRVSKEIGDGPATKRRVLDLCAAPGGKAVGLAWNGFEVTATDYTEARMPLLKSSVARAAPGIKVIPWKDRYAGLDPDLIWVDAPCTGSGILRRHPDIRWLKKEGDLESLAVIQKDLLREAWDHVNPGGFLVYSVCSILKSEGPAILEACDLLSAKVEEWSLGPHEPPFGDGFWGVLLKKPSKSFA